MKINSKVRKNGGSYITVVPSTIAQMIELEPGNELVWETTIENNNPIIKVSKKVKKPSD